MTERAFRPGFRLYPRDIVVIVLGAAGATLLAVTEVWDLALVVAFVISHFFLFCNVFRLARPGELVWAAVFLSCAGGTITRGVPGWTVTTALSLLTMVIVVFMETRKPSYHGVGWRRINPGLREWWEAHAG